MLMTDTMHDARKTLGFRKNLERIMNTSKNVL